MTDFSGGVNGGTVALPPALVQTLQFCVNAWIADFERFGIESCRKLSLGVRFSGMRMLKVYLTPSSGVMSGYADVPSANRMLQWMLAWTPPPHKQYVRAAYRHLPDLVHYVMEKEEDEEEEAAAWDGPPPDLDPQEEAQRMALEVAIVECFESLFALGPLSAGGGEATQRLSLDVCQMLALRGPHLRKPVESALAAFLRCQPDFVGLYFKMSVVEYAFDQNGLTMPAAELLASIHLAATVQTWCGNLVEWQTRHSVPMPHMLLVALLHQCSPDQASRASAIELATALARHPTEPLDAGSALPTTEFVTLSSCVASAYKYSQVLAVHYSRDLGESLLREHVAIATLLPDVQNESMLHMILPWILHFGTDFTDETIGEWQGTWLAFLGHLLNLSHQCHERANSSFLFFTLEACWTAVLSNKPSKALCELTMDFLVTTHAEAALNATARAPTRVVRGGLRECAADGGGAPAADGACPRSSATCARGSCSSSARAAARRRCSAAPGLPTRARRRRAAAADAGGGAPRRLGKRRTRRARRRRRAPSTRRSSVGLPARVGAPPAHVEALSHQVPAMLNLALVKYGAHAAGPPASSCQAAREAHHAQQGARRRSRRRPPTRPRASSLTALCAETLASRRRTRRRRRRRRCARGRARAQPARGVGGGALAWALDCPDEEGVLRAISGSSCSRATARWVRRAPPTRRLPAASMAHRWGAVARR